MEPDLQKPSFSRFGHEQKNAKIASESSLLVTYQCSLILMVEKTTLTAASLQRPQLLIHIGEAYQN